MSERVDTIMDERYDFGDLEISDPHRMKVREMMDHGNASLDGLSVALQRVIDQEYEQYDANQRQENMRVAEEQEEEPEESE